jgi:LuxR family transcriptional regulator, activator of tox operons
MPSVRIAATRPGKIELDVEATVAFMSEAGTERSVDAMLTFCRKCLGADFVSIFTYARTCVPALVGTATTTAADNARKAAIGYLQHFANDVNFALTSRRWAGAYLTYQTADEIASSHYRRACYDRTGIADRFSLVCIGPARSTSISVYRSRNSGRFSDCELDRASALMPILKASIDRREAANSGPPITTIEEILAHLQSRYPALSARELQVAARVKAGLSARQIAAELGLAETTVITHRNSVYARIGVANLRQLLLA